MSIPTKILVIAAVLAVASLLLASTRAAVWRLLHQSSFVAGAIVLTIGALSLNTSTQWLKLHFKKQAAPLRVQSLSDTTDGIPAHLGSWMQVSDDPPIDPELEAALKTREYIFRDYINSAVIGPAETAALGKETGATREQHLAELRTEYPPQTFIRLGVTFNTGLVDTVTHIPENCYVASGYQPSSWEVKYATCGKFPDGSPRDISYRYINFEDETGAGRLGCRVGYLFSVDGVYENSPYAVRNKLQNLFERYGYYAKVEMMTTEPLHDSSASADSASDAATVGAMNNLLTALLPQLERCLPDWKQLHQR